MNGWRRFRAVATVAVALPVVAAVSASTGATTVRQNAVIEQRWTLWRGLVESHAVGTRDRAVVELARWGYDDLLVLLPRVSQLEPSLRLPLVERALVAHADVAIAHRRPIGYGLPAHGRPVQLFADGAPVGEASATYHWDFSRQLIERLPRGAERTTVATLFYRATSLLLLEWSSHIEFDAHVERARRELGDDPVLLLCQGIRQQAYAHPRARLFFEELRRRLSRAGRGTGDRGAAPTSLASARSNAERAFRQALDADRDLHEARIRLAHLLHDRGRDGDALRELAGVPIDTLAPPLAYYARVVEGLVHRQVGELDRARSAFESALVLVSDSQVARLALSEIANAQGERPDANRVLASLDGGADDPWWSLSRPFLSAEAAIMTMRRAFDQ